jgi:hypothetical protein
MGRNIIIYTLKWKRKTWAEPCLGISNSVLCFLSHVRAGFFPAGMKIILKILFGNVFEGFLTRFYELPGMHI